MRRRGRGEGRGKVDRFGGGYVLGMDDGVWLFDISLAVCLLCIALAGDGYGKGVLGYLTS